MSTSTKSAYRVPEDSHYVDMTCGHCGCSDLVYVCASLRTDPPVYGCENCCTMFTKRTRTTPVKCPACCGECFWFNGKDGRELVCPNCTCFAPTL